MEIEPTRLPVGWGRCGEKSPDEACIESGEQQVPSHSSLQGPLGFCGTSLSLSQQLQPGAERAGLPWGKGT